MFQQDDDEPKRPSITVRNPEPGVRYDSISAKAQLKEIDSLQVATLENVRRYVSDVLTKTGGPDLKREERLRGKSHAKNTESGEVSKIAAKIEIREELTYEEEERIAIIESDKDSVYW